MTAEILPQTEGCTVGCFEFVVQPVREGLFVVSLDITEPKCVETALRESETELLAMTANIEERVHKDSRFIVVPPLLATSEAS